MPSLAEIAAQASLLGRDVAQGASNETAGMVSGPVDLIAAGMNRLGVPVGSEPLGGSAWMGRMGLTAPVQNQAAGLIGQTAGLVAPAAIVSAAPRVARGLLDLGDWASSRFSPALKASEIPSETVPYASSSGKMNTPQSIEQRPFHEDYSGARESYGRSGEALHTDIDGRPLYPGSIRSGRRTVDGPDVPISNQELDDVLRRLGIDTSSVPRSGDALRGDAGRYVRGPGPDGEVSRSIFIDQALPSGESGTVLRHELGHAIEDLTTGRAIPTSGLKKELLSNYEQLNTPGSFKPGRGLSPKALGYSAADADRELMTEALRSYMTDPNAMKANYPKTAARIREYVNTNPNLNKVIQFNTLAHMAPFGLMGQGWDWVPGSQRGQE